VTDNTPPTVVLPFDDVVVNVTPGTCINNTTTLTPPTVSDNCSAPGSLTVVSNAPAAFLLGTTNVRWTITDESGNQTVYTQKVTVNDNEGPVITGCSAPASVQASGGECKAVVSWPPLVATVACSGVKSFT
jgi:hypothetical protein